MSNPAKKEATTNKDIQGRYSELTSSAYGRLIVAPRITIPICSGMVPTFLEMNVLGGLKK